MIRNFQKTCLGLLFAISASFVSADDCCYNDYAYCDEYGTFGVHGEYLFWTARIADMDFARRLTFNGQNSNGLFNLGTLEHDEISKLSHKWRSGFRVGVDYKCSLEDPWRYAAYYTYYRTSDSLSRVCKDNGNEGNGASENGNCKRCFLVPQIPFEINGVELPQWGETYVIGQLSENGFWHSLREAGSDTSLRLDFGDVEVTRINCLCGPATFNVLVGVRGGYIRNNWSTRFFFVDDKPPMNSEVRGWYEKVKADIDNHWRYLSIGPRVGGQFDWCVGYGFSFYIDTSLTALWGKVKNDVKVEFSGNHKDVATAQGDGIHFQEMLCDLQPSRYKVVPVFQGEAGLAWFYTFENFVIDAKIGVELLHFLDLAENHHFPRGFPGRLGSIRSLDLYGLTAGLGFLF